MSRKIEVIGISGTPDPDLKKFQAVRLVRRGWACWLIPNVSIRRFSVRETRIVTTPAELARRRALYIPPGLAPAEIPGVYFEAPRPQPSALVFAMS